MWGGGKVREGNKREMEGYIYKYIYYFPKEFFFFVVNASVGGVGMLIGPRGLKTLISIESLQPRMMAATFNGNHKATIISCYSPTNVSEENEIVTFYEDLSSLVRSIPKHNLLVIGGDMNAQIGKNRNNKYILHNVSNRNGQHLIDFMIENRLTCLNTNFQKREGKLWTYTYANKSKAQIDYVFINKKWKKQCDELRGILLFRGCVLRSSNSYGQSTTKPTKKRHTKSDNQALWLGPTQQQRY